eukprot:s1725_g1.t1
MSIIDDKCLELAARCTRMAALMPELAEWKARLLAHDDFSHSKTKTSCREGSGWLPKVSKQQPHRPHTFCLVIFFSRARVRRMRRGIFCSKVPRTSPRKVGPVITPRGRADPAEDSSKDRIG